MKLSFIMIGIIFLLNPVVGVNDFLPDLIGCCFIMAGIRDGAYMIEKLESARRWFRYGALVSVIRFIVSSFDVQSQHTLPLVLAFSFAVVELIVYIPAFKELFEGFNYAAMRHGGTEVLSIGKKTGFYYDINGKRQYGEYQVDTTGKLATASQIFIIIRAAASVLPELPSLQLSDSMNLGDVGAFQFNSIRNLIALASAVIVLIPAVILLVKYIRFIKRIGSVGDFIPKLNAELSERFGGLEELHTCSRMKTMSMTAGAALILYMGFYDYQINVVQRYYPAIILCAATVMLFISAGKKLWMLAPVIPAAVTIPLSFRTYSLQYDHYYMYKMQMMSLYESGNEHVYDRNFNEMTEEYLPMAVTESIEAFVLGIAVVLFLVFYLKAALAHARTFSSVPQRLRGDITKSLKIRGGIMIAGGVLTACYFTAYRFILPYFDLAPITGVGVNILALVLFVVFAMFVNEFVYSNLHGVTVAPGENDPCIGVQDTDSE